MATLIKGLLAFNLDWQFVMVGVALAIDRRAVRRQVAVVRGGRLPAAVDHRARSSSAASYAPSPSGPRRKAGGPRSHADAELGPGNLFATGLVAGGAVAGVVVALLTVIPSVARGMKTVSLEASPGAAVWAPAATSSSAWPSSPRWPASCGAWHGGRNGLTRPVAREGARLSRTSFDLGLCLSFDNLRRHRAPGVSRTDERSIAVLAVFGIWRDEQLRLRQAHEVARDVAPRSRKDLP